MSTEKRKKLQSKMTHCIEYRPKIRHGIACRSTHDFQCPKCSSTSFGTPNYCRPEEEWIRVCAACSFEWPVADDEKYWTLPKRSYASEREKINAELLDALKALTACTIVAKYPEDTKAFFGAISLAEKAIAKAEGE